MASPLTGKVAVVTGGSRGIGLAIARALVNHGLNVTITGTNERVLAAAVRELEPAADGGAVLGQAADVRRSDDVDRVFSETATRFGGIDLLVNNAGVGIFAPVADMSADQWRQVIDTNVTGVFHCCHAALPHLRRRGGGWIVNISSLSATNAFANGAAYCASKAALNAFSEALMQEVRHEGVRVAYVMPGSVNTGFMGQTPHGEDWKLAPEDVAEVVIDLLRYPSRSLLSRVEIRPSRPPKKG